MGENTVVWAKKFEPERDQLGVLWAKYTKRRGVVLQGKIATDDGELEVVAFPFLTRTFRSGVTLCLARDFDQEGGSTRSDGEREEKDACNRRKRKKKDEKPVHEG